MGNGKTLIKVRYKDIFELFGGLDLFRKDTGMIQNIYREENACIRIRKWLEQVHNIERYIEQRCVLSPDLFNVSNKAILWELGLLT